MTLIATKIVLKFDKDLQPEITLTLKENRQMVQKNANEWQQIIDKGKELSIEIKQNRKKRSLDANGYMWLLLSQMAAILITTKDELYLQMLDRYGVFTHIVVKPNMVDKVKQEWRMVRELGEVIVNGKPGIQLQCFFGSSGYDSKEMSDLLEGVVSEAKEIGVDTMTENERLKMLSEWGNVA